MRNHIDKLTTELRATRFPFEDDFPVHWIADPEEAIAITKSDPVEIHIPKVRSEPMSHGFASQPMCAAAISTAAMAGPVSTGRGNTQEGTL